MEAHTSYAANYTNFTIPVIKVNGKNVEGDGITERYGPFAPESALTERRTALTLVYSIRNKYSPLCHEVVTACDSGRTHEEGIRAYREHQQTKINELQVSRSRLDVDPWRSSEQLYQELMKDCSLMDCN